MSVSPSRYLAAITFVTFVLAHALAAVAQTGQPRSLIPDPAAPGEQRRPSPSPFTGTTEPEAPPTSRTAPEIEVGTLDRPDPSAVGLILERDGGFPIDMWQGSNRTLVERLIERVPAPVESRVRHDLLRRLLLTTANVPEGAPADGDAAMLLRARVQRLAAAGAYEEALRLLRAASIPRGDPALARVEIESLWLAGDNVGACAVAYDMQSRERAPYWLKAASFCRLIEGNSDAAALGVRILQEEGIDDPTFFQLYGLLAGERNDPPKSLADPAPLEFAMARAAKIRLPDDIVDTGHIGIVRAVAVLPSAPMPLRLTAAEIAESHGALATEVLIEIYAAQPFEGSPADVLRAARDRSGPRINALLYQAVAREPVPAARAEILQLAWQRALEAGRFGPVARANAAAAKSLNPGPELAWLAAEAARAMFAAGDWPRAVAWYDVVRRQGAGGDAAAAEAARTLWPVAQIGGIGARLFWDPAAAADWLRETASEGSTAGIKDGAFVLMTLDALGRPVPDDLWSRLYEDAAERSVPGAPAILVRGLEAAAAGRRLGETVLFALLVLGPSPPGETGAAEMAAVARALTEVGLAAEAQSLAVEAALARSL